MHLGIILGGGGVISKREHFCTTEIENGQKPMTYIPRHWLWLKLMGRNSAMPRPGSESDWGIPFKTGSGNLPDRQLSRRSEPAWCQIWMRKHRSSRWFQVLWGEVKPGTPPPLVIPRVVAVSREIKLLERILFSAPNVRYGYFILILNLYFLDGRANSLWRFFKAYRVCINSDSREFLSMLQAFSAIRKKSSLSEGVGVLQIIET